MSSQRVTLSCSNVWYVELAFSFLFISWRYAATASLPAYSGIPELETLVCVNIKHRREQNPKPK